MKIYFATHSTTTDNETGLASGWNNPGLSETGINQARELGDIFKDTKLDLICCSDSKRAIETATIAFGNKLSLTIDERLREINYGDYNGRPAEDIDHIRKNRITEPFPNGESYEQAEARIHGFVRELKESHPEKTVLIIGHRATRYGLDTFSGTKTIKECMTADFGWQPYWEYEI